MFLKKLLATAIICFCTNVFFAQAQNLYHDAIILSKWDKKPTIDTLQLNQVAVILNKIYTAADTAGRNLLLNDSTILGAIRNKFLKYSNSLIIDYNKKAYEDIRKALAINNENKTTNETNKTKLIKELDTLDKYTDKIKKHRDALNILNNYSTNRENILVKPLLEEANKEKDTISIKDKLSELISNRIKDIENKIKADSIKIKNGEINVKNELKTLNAFGNSLLQKLESTVSISDVKSLKEFDPEAQNLNKTEVINRHEYSVNNGKEVANLGMPTQSQIIDGISMYLASRVKQEAIIFFAERLRKKLTVSDSSKLLIKHLATIIPETAKKFKAWDAMSVPNFDDSWKYAFSKDLLNLPLNGLKYLDKDTLSDGMRLDYIQDAVTISGLVIKKNNWIEIAEQLAKNPYNSSIKSKLHSEEFHLLMRLMYIINTEMYSPEKKREYWITADEFDNNKEHTAVFINLILAKYPDIKSYLNYDLAIENSNPQYLAQFQAWLSGVLLSLEHLQKNYYPTKKNSDNDYNINSYWLSITELVDQTLTNGCDSRVLHITNFNNDKNLTNVKDLFETYQLIQNKNYAAAADACLAILKSYQKDENNEALNEAAKLVSFFSAILQSKSNEDVQAAVQSFALPLSSYRLKKTYKSSVTVGAYFGGYGGAEFIKGGQTAGVVGLSAPISLDFNWRTGQTSYLTLSFIGLDLGAAVSYRLRSSGEGLPQEVRWSQFFSPGLNLRVSLANSPITFSFGGQLTPELRDFNNSVRNDAIRATAGIMIDMPFLLLKRKEQPLKIGANKSKNNTNSTTQATNPKP